jgi:molybdopterin converting factor small subunit
MNRAAEIERLRAANADLAWDMQVRRERTERGEDPPMWSAPEREPVIYSVRVQQPAPVRPALTGEQIDEIGEALGEVRRQLRAEIAAEIAKARADHAAELVLLREELDRARIELATAQRSSTPPRQGVRHDAH